MSPLLTVHEAAELLRLSDAAVYALCKSGELPHHRLGKGRGAIRIGEADLLAYLARTKSGASPVGPDPASQPAPSAGKAGPPAGAFKHLRVDRLLGGPPPASGRSSGRGGRSAR
jgi:excisionase family DNA binding protein